MPKLSGINFLTILKADEILKKTHSTIVLSTSSNTKTC
jgi:CheY-like chemotaxis protein